MPDGRLVLVAGKGSIAIIASREQDTWNPLNTTNPTPYGLTFIQNQYGGHLLFFAIAGSTKKLRAIMCAPSCPGGQICNEDGVVVSGCAAGTYCPVGATSAWGVTWYKGELVAG